LGTVLEKLGHRAEAARQYEQQLELQPDYAAARNALKRLQAGDSP